MCMAFWCLEQGLAGHCTPCVHHRILFAQLNGGNNSGSDTSVREWMNKSHSLKNWQVCSNGLILYEMKNDWEYRIFTGMLKLLLSCEVTSNFLGTHRLPPARLPCPSLSPRVYSKSCPLNQWHHPTISSSDALFSFCLQFFPALGSFPMSWLKLLQDEDTKQYSTPVYHSMF